MADLGACRAALDGLSAKLVAAGRALPERTVSCTITDLDVVFHAQLRSDGLHDITTEEHPPAKVRLTLTSDDLVDLVEGRLNAGKAFASGRLGIKASFGDLMMLRSLG